MVMKNCIIKSIENISTKKVENGQRIILKEEKRFVINIM